MKSVPRDKYLEILSYVPALSVDIILYREISNNRREVLLVERAEEPAKGLLYPIGGGVFKGEFSPMAALRKVKTETGLSAQLERFFGVYETVYPKAQDSRVLNGLHTIDLAFSAFCLDNQEVKLDFTSSGYKWIRKQEVSKLPHYSRKLIENSGIFTNKFNGVHHELIDYRITPIN